MTDEKARAQITRQRNKEIRDAARAEREALEKTDRALVLGALRAVLQDPDATAAQRIYAVAVLDNIQRYYLVPYGVKHPGEDNNERVAEFVRILKEQERDGKF